MKEVNYECKNNELGKYNFGLTDSVILLGSNATLIHKFSSKDIVSPDLIDGVILTNDPTDPGIDP